ncbi:TMEM175 family protein [Lactiplantibacillus plantarum]|uniref:TMEM175 family protein n=1 Tax=Lactiplantibacillus plantarum TaxID=1590 RepID=UPI002001D190|nr:TMEM175 family protein [Lactiplantibacillus plantarum]
MNKARLEAFTDAIIAIVLTLLVLDLPRPQTPSVRALFAEWQSIYVYIITFTLLISIWLNHHDLFVQVKKIDRVVFGANSFWLLCQSFIPFMASWITKFPHSKWPAVFYILTGFVWMLAYQILVAAVRRLNPHIHRMSSPALSVVFGGFLVVLTVALINPDVGLFLIPVHAFASVILATKRKWHLRKYF